MLAPPSSIHQSTYSADLGAGAPWEAESGGGAGGVPPPARASSLDDSALSRHRGHTCDRDFLTLQCLKCGQQHVVRAGSRDRTCPLCSVELYERVYRRYRDLFQGGGLKFLTLTWKPVKKQSPEVVRSLGRCFVKLLHRAPYKTVWKGVLATVECKKTVSGLFYYHLHAILRGGFVSQARISRDWCRISGFPVVCVKAISRTPRRALRYVLKYVLKGFAFSNPKDVSDFKASMHGVRYVRSYGEFYACEYRHGRHVYFPCPGCGAVKSWVILEFCDLVALPLGEPYNPG